MTTINIKGTIVSDNDKPFYDMLGLTATAPKDIVLPENGEPVEVIINSGGGDVYAGSEIYTALRSYAGDVTVKIVGIAASAASVIAMAGDVVEISPVAQFMIHNVSAGRRGDNRDFAHEAEVLAGFNHSIANSYVAKTGKGMAELLELMNKESWFTAEKAVEHGFADKIMFAQEEAPLLVASSSPVLSSEVLGKLANLKQMDSSAMDMDRLADKIAERLVQKTAQPVQVILTADGMTTAIGAESIKTPDLAAIDDKVKLALESGAITFNEQTEETPQGLGRFCF